MSAFHIQRKLRKPLIWLVVFIGLVTTLKLTVLAPAQINTIKLARHDLTAQIFGNGTVEAKVVVPVSSKVTSRIEALYVDQGDIVKSGQVLVRLEDEDYYQQVLVAEAEVKKAEAACTAAEADQEKASANLELAQKNYGRISAMGEKNLVSQQNVDEQSAALVVAQKEVELTKAAVDFANKECEAAKANLAFAQSRKNDMVITAPTDGIIISRELEKGSIVGPGFPIFRLADTSVVWITAHIDESCRQDLAVGQLVIILLRSSPQKTLKGRVVRIGLESDRVTEEIEVNVTFEPPYPPFRVGEQAEIYITTAVKKNVQALPAGTVVSKGKQRKVWIVNNGELKSHDIETGIEDRTGFVEVLSGIDEETLVAMAPPPVMMGFKDGLSVRVKR